MKFTDGYWLLDPHYDIAYALQYERASIGEKSVSMLCPCRPTASRGDMLDGPLLTVSLSSPRENVIRVKVEHFRGTPDKNPRYAIVEEDVAPLIEETESHLTFTSGRASAKVCKAHNGWKISFCRDGEEITSTGYHGMAHIVRKGDGRAFMCDSLMMDVGEKIYGFGEQFTPYIKNGQSIDIWNADGGTASQQAYKSIPFYMTNRGYGVLVESSKDVSFEIGSEKVERVQFSHPGECLVYDVIMGDNQKDIISTYTALTGRPALPPAWSFGLWLSTSFTTSYDEKTVNSFIDGMFSRDIPLSVFHFDCYWMRERNLCDLEWNPDIFPDPEGMLRRLHEKGLHICCWINPYISQCGRLFDEGLAGGYFVKRKDGSVWQSDRWEPGMAILDVTNPAAREWFCGYLKKLLNMGVDCFKTDFGERIPVKDIAWYDGSGALGMHNYYPLLYNRMVFDVIKEVKGEQEALVFARCACVGGQQYPVHWNGDSTASYVSMAETLRSGLSIAQSGFAFWSHDISGFESTAPADVYKRWAAFGLLCSHSRLHGSSSYRVPWLFDEESVEVVRFFTHLKCRLMPYLYACAVEAHEKGIPMMRPMVMEFPGDISAENCDTQFMLGSSLLVAPVFHKDGHVDYWLPEGSWTSLITGEVIRGGCWRHEQHGFMSLPLLVREGSVIPMGARADRPDYRYADEVELHIYCPKEGTTSLTIPGLDGKTDAAYSITIKDGNVEVTTESKLPYTVKLH